MVEREEGLAVGASDRSPTPRSKAQPFGNEPCITCVG